jgi:hypothetical protein
MTLLTFELTTDVIGHIKELIRQGREELPSIQDPEGKQEALARIVMSPDTVKCGEEKGLPAIHPICTFLSPML